MISDEDNYSNNFCEFYESIIWVSVIQPVLYKFI